MSVMTKGNFHAVLRHLHFARHWLERAEGEFSRAETDQAELTLSLAEAEVREAWEESRRVRAARLNLLSETMQDWKRRASAVPVRVRGLWAGACGAVVVGGLLALSTHQVGAPLVPAGSAQAARKADARAANAVSQTVSLDKPSLSVAGASDARRTVSPVNRDSAETKVRKNGNNTTKAGNPLPVAAGDRVGNIAAHDRLAGVLPQALSQTQRDLESAAAIAVPVNTEAPRVVESTKVADPPKVVEATQASEAIKTPVIPRVSEAASVAAVPKAAVVPKAPVTSRVVDAAKPAEAPKGAATVASSEQTKPSEADAPAKTTVSLDLMELLQAAQQSLYNK